VARLTNATGYLDTKNGFALNLALLPPNYGVVLFWVAIAKTNMAFAGVADRASPRWCVSAKTLKIARGAFDKRHRLPLIPKTDSR
jgi:hypothetical protein